MPIIGHNATLTVNGKRLEAVEVLFGKPPTQEYLFPLGKVWRVIERPKPAFKPIKLRARMLSFEICAEFKEGWDLLWSQYAR